MLAQVAGARENAAAFAARKNALATGMLFQVFDEHLTAGERLLVTASSTAQEFLFRGSLADLFHVCVGLSAMARQVA